MEFCGRYRNRRVYADSAVESGRKYLLHRQSLSGESRRKSKYPELIERFNIPLDEYPRRCINQIARWKDAKLESLDGKITHTRSREYASRIMESMVTDTPYQIGGNVLNKGHLITNLPEDACVEVPCLVNKYGIQPTYIGNLPTQLAAMNSSNIYPQLLTIEAAATGSIEKLYQAAMMDPRTGMHLSTDEIVAMVDELVESHTNAGYPIF